MMKLEFVEEVSGSSDQIIVKGERAKRRRPLSSTGGDFYNFPVSSPTTEEDEDMAHCLILLARGSSTSKSQKEAGVYVYECKTCNRAFSSFQALGGHRASHKRPKTAEEDNRKKSPPSLPLPDNKGNEEGQFHPAHLTNLVIDRVCYNGQDKHKVHECSICGSEFGSGQALGEHVRRHRIVASARDVCENPRNILALDLDLNLSPPPQDHFPALLDCHY